MIQKDFINIVMILVNKLKKLSKKKKKLKDKTLVIAKSYNE